MTRTEVIRIIKEELPTIYMEKVRFINLLSAWQLGNLPKSMKQKAVSTVSLTRLNATAKII